MIQYQLAVEVEVEVVGVVVVVVAAVHGALLSTVVVCLLYCNVVRCRNSTDRTSSTDLGYRAYRTLNCYFK